MKNEKFRDLALLSEEKPTTGWKQNRKPACKNKWLYHIDLKI